MGVGLKCPTFFMSNPEIFPAKEFKKIGILDSGIGGLAVMQPLLKSFPAQYYYFADLKNLPYGSKSKKELLSISCKNIDHLLSCDVKIIVIACHTISAVIFDDLKKNYPQIFFIDVIQPVIQKARAISKNKKIGVIGTTATIESHVYKKSFFIIDPAVNLYEQACPNLASLIEEFPVTHSIIKHELEKNLYSFADSSIDTLILGCTHYEWIKEVIQDYTNATIISVESEIVSYFLQKNFTASSSKSFIVCIFSKANIPIKKRFKHFLNNLNVPFSIKTLNQKFI